MRIVPASPASIEAELVGATSLAVHLDAQLAPDWPPEHHDADLLRHTASQLERPGHDGWWLHYIVVDAGTRPVAVGTCGFKGPPRHGTIELGYSVVASHRRRGIATVAVEALLTLAVSRDPTVTTAVADTLPHLAPSVRVLEKLGFEPADAPEPGVLRFRLRLDGPHAGHG